MNIFHIITTINRGGAENQLIQNLLTQSKNGLNINVVFLKGNGYWKDLLVKENIKVYGPFFNKFYYFNPLGLLSIFKIINQKNIILHCHMPPSLVLINLLSFFTRNKIIYTSHNDEPFFPNKILEKLFAKIILIKPKYIIAITSTVKDFLVSKYKLNPSRIKVIDYSFESSIYKINSNSKEFDFYKKGNEYIGIVARLVPQKRVDLLIKSFKEVLVINRNIFLVIIGNGSLKEELMLLSKEFDLEKNIIWIDYSEFVVEHMKRWSLFCLTSKYEGFGLVLLEAIYAKIPILAMNVSSIKDIIGPCGRVVDFGDYLEFAKNILYILKNKEDYFSNDHINKFSPEINFKKHLETYLMVK